MLATCCCSRFFVVLINMSLTYSYFVSNLSHRNLKMCYRLTASCALKSSSQTIINGTHWKEKKKNIRNRNNNNKNLAKQKASNFQWPWSILCAYAYLRTRASRIWKMLLCVFLHCHMIFNQCCYCFFLVFFSIHGGEKRRKTNRFLHKFAHANQHSIVFCVDTLLCKRCSIRNAMINEIIVYIMLTIDLMRAKY